MEFIFFNIFSPTKRMSFKNRLGSEVWNYFEKCDSERAVCNNCNKKLCCKGSSTSNLKSHLKAVHNITFEKNMDAPINIGEASASTSCTKRKQCNLHSFLKRSTLEEIVAKLVAKDGISANSVMKSSFIRESIQERGFSLPKTHSRVMELVHTFFEQAKQETIEFINAIKKRDGKFALTLDE